MKENLISFFDRSRCQHVVKKDVVKIFNYHFKSPASLNISWKNIHDCSLIENILSEFNLEFI